MDDQLRALYRRWAQSGPAQDGAAYYIAALRGGHQVDLEGLAEVFPIITVQEIAYHNPRLLVLGGRNLDDIVNQICRPMVLQRLNEVPVAVDRGMIYTSLCQVRESASGQIIYRIYYFTVTITQLPCPSCQQRGPHHCDTFWHPDAEDGVNLDASGIESFEYDDPMYADAAESDPPIKRHWFPTQKERDMGDVYGYTINQYIIENADPGPNHTTLSRTEGWYLLNEHPISSFNDPDQSDIAKIQGQLEARVKQQYGTYRRTAPQYCINLYNNISELIKPGAHEPLESAPSLDHAPCEDFRIIPGGQIAWGVDASGSRVFEDGTTVCGHGYLKEPRIAALCPPRWSDGEQAGWRCNSCGKLLGMSAGKPNQFVLCRPCQLSIKLTRQAEEGGPVRVKQEKFRCPCRTWFDSLEDAMNCCGEPEEEIGVSESWGWDDGWD